MCAALLDQAPGLFTAASVNARTKEYGMTALHLAAEHGHAGVGAARNGLA